MLCRRKNAAEISSGTGSPGRWVWLVCSLIVLHLCSACVGIKDRTTISTSLLPRAQPSVPYSTALEAKGGRPPYHWALVSGTLPRGIDFDPSAGVLSGVPTQSGNYSFKVAVSDSSPPPLLTTTDVRTMALAVGLTPLQIATTALSSAQVGMQFREGLTVAGGVQPYHWSVASGALPSGISLNADNGTLSGTPSQGGQVNFSVRVSDRSSPSPQTTLKVLSLAVGPLGLQITTSDLPNAQVGVQSQASLAATGGVQPYRWSIASGTLPSGIFLNAATGVISGMASQGGEFDFSAQVSDSSSPTPQIAMKPLRLAVVAFALQIISGGLPSGQVGAPYQASLTGNGGVTPYTWIIAGPLPSGLNLNSSSGTITGTPTQPGTSTLTILLRDSGGQSAQQSSSIAIIAADAHPLSISTTTLPQPVVGQVYSQTLQATGGTPPYAWSIKSGQLPAGLSLSATGQITGTLSAAGQPSFAVQVVDSSPSPLSASKTFIFTPTSTSTPSVLDQYGGDAKHPCAGVSKNGGAIPGATGFFYLYKDTNLKRWMFCDPLGNRFYMQDVQLIDGVYDGGGYSNKYGSGLYDYFTVQSARLKSLGFNTIGEYANLRMLPVSTYRSNDGGNPSKMPFKFIVRPLIYAPRYQAVKPVFPLLPPAYNNYRGGSFADVFDPGFATFVNSMFGPGDQTFPGGGTPAALDASPWLIGVSVDDGDNLWGLKDIAIDIGWLTGVSAPYMASSPSTVSYAVYTDTKFYLKDQLKSYLTAKYGTIAGLNAAWGSNYTTFGSSAASVTNETIGTGDGITTSFSHTFSHTVVDPASVGISVGGVLQAGDCPWFNTTYALSCNSVPVASGVIKPASGTINGGTINYSTGAITINFSAAPATGVAITATYQYGGWPKATAGGMGLLDEDGTSSWYPPCCGFTIPPVGTRATDLHGFLTVTAQQYYSTVFNRLRVALPHHLIFTTNFVDPSTASPDLLVQAGQYADAFSAPGGPAAASYNMLGIPIIPSLLQIANEDSSFSNTPNPFQHCLDSGAGSWCVHTQAARGAAYQGFMSDWWSGSSHIGADGYGFLLGMDWFAWVDKNNERQNFGMLTLRDNFYDGFQNTTTSHSDPFMNGSSPSTIPEVINMGDFISHVKVANQIWLGP